VEKGPDAFRTISEVAEDLNLPQHVLRFWETRFGQIKPLKRGGGRRYYRPEDVDLLRGIRHLLYGEGYTIRGVQQILREQGVRHVQAIGQSAESEEVRSEAALADPARAVARARPEGGALGGLIDLLPSLRARRQPPSLPRVVEVPLPRPEASGGDDELPPFLRRTSARPAPRGGSRPLEAAEAVVDIDAEALSQLTSEGADLLKMTLNEVGECRRILDTAFDRNR
jgi:DNA-binding transcriptional MerR regulator